MVAGHTKIALMVTKCLLLCQGEWPDKFQAVMQQQLLVRIATEKLNSKTMEGE